MRAAIVVLALAGTASAGNNEVSIGPWNRALRASSADAVTSNDLVGGLLTYARALDIAVASNVTLWAVGGFAWSGTTGTMFQMLDTDVGNVAFTIGGRARYALWNHVAFGAGLDIGTARTRLTLSEGSYEASDSGWG